MQSTSTGRTRYAGRATRLRDGCLVVQPSRPRVLVLEVAVRHQLVQARQRRLHDPREVRHAPVRAREVLIPVRCFLAAPRA